MSFERSYKFILDWLTCAKVAGKVEVKKQKIEVKRNHVEAKANRGNSEKWKEKFQDQKIVWNEILFH